MMIRHGEKPMGGVPPNGITSDGVIDDHSLIVRGWQRAGALVDVFMNGTRPGVSTPQFVFAASGSQGTRGLRSRETVTPLVDRLDINVVANFGLGVGQEADAGAEIMGCFGVVLVAWEHHNLPVIASHFPHSVKSTAVPMWPDDRFDLIWIFDFDVECQGYVFSQTPQLLLAGDRGI